MNPYTELKERVAEVNEQMARGAFWRWLFGRDLRSTIVVAPRANGLQQIRGEQVDEYTPAFHWDDRFYCDSRKGGGRCGCSWSRRDGDYHHCDNEPEITYVNPPFKQRPSTEKSSQGQTRGGSRLE